MVRIVLLGEVGLRVDGKPVNLGPPRQRCAFSALAVDSGRLVLTDEVARRVWGAETPLRGRATLHSYVSRLRGSCRGAFSIDYRSGGYILSVENANQVVDLLRFRDLRARARQIDDPAGRLALLSEAVALWSGEPLAGVSGDWAEQQRARLLQERWTAEQDLIDARLHTGEGGRLVAQLLDRTAQHPLDERAAAQCMMALHQAGRTGDALKHYRATRERLRDDLGTDPGRELQELHQQILAGEHALTPAAVTVTADRAGELPLRLPAAPTPFGVRPTPRLRDLHARDLSGSGPDTGAVPRQLPAAAPSFIGRTNELAALDRMLASPGLVAVVSGPGGLGKTWLAVQWSTDHASRFADGQLHVDLRGFDPIHEPVTAERALCGFLGALGVAPESIPREQDEQVALYRSLTAGRRLLVVLDNARGTDQVIPLLPGGASCSVLVTSRHELGGLLTTRGASALPLRPLDERQSRELLAYRVGAARLAEEPEAVQDILHQCGGMSLALAIVAARVAAQPGRRLASLASELHGSPLDALDTGELTASLRAVFEASYRSLDPDAAAAFRLLGLVPGDDVERAAATALLGETRPLRMLCAANLVEEYRPGRFRMHDLVKFYAAELVAEIDDADTRLAASSRLFDHYLCWASAAMERFSPQEPCLRRPAEQSIGPQPRFADAQAAQVWLDAELANLLALATHAPAALIGHVVRLSETLWRYLHVTSLYHEALALHMTALALTRPGTLERGFASKVVGSVLIALGRFDEAAEHLDLALSLALGQGSDFLESMVRGPLATIDDIRGRRPAARAQLEAALAAARRAGHAFLEGMALFNLGEHYRRCGDCQIAVDYLTKSGAIAQDLGSAVLGAPVLAALGNTYAGLGQPGKADDHFRRALEFARRGRNIHLEISTLNDFAGTKTGVQAIELYEEALALAQRVGHLHERARAHHGLGTAHRAAANDLGARPHLEAALAAYTELRTPGADDVRDLLEVSVATRTDLT